MSLVVLPLDYGKGIISVDMIGLLVYYRGFISVGLSATGSIVFAKYTVFFLLRSV